MRLRTLFIVALVLSLISSFGQAASAKEISQDEALRIINTTKFHLVSEHELPASVLAQTRPSTINKPTIGKSSRYCWVICWRDGPPADYYLFDIANKGKATLLYQASASDIHNRFPTTVVQQAEALKSAQRADEERKKFGKLLREDEALRIINAEEFQLIKEQELPASIRSQLSPSNIHRSFVKAGKSSRHCWVEWRPSDTPADYYLFDITMPNRATLVYKTNVNDRGLRFVDTLYQEIRLAEDRPKEDEALRILKSTKFEAIAEKELPAFLQAQLVQPSPKRYEFPPPGTPGDPRFGGAGKGGKYYWVIQWQSTSSARGTISYYYLFEEAKLVYKTSKDSGLHMSSQIGSAPIEPGTQAGARFRSELDLLSSGHL